MTRIAILGSTGSIGTSALDVARTHADRVEVVALAAGTNVAAMVKQVLEFRPRAVAMATGDAMDKLAKDYHRKNINSWKDSSLPSITAVTSTWAWAACGSAPGTPT